MDSSSSDDEVLPAFKQAGRPAKKNISRLDDRDSCDESDKEVNTDRISNCEDEAENSSDKDKIKVYSKKSQTKIAEDKSSSSESENQEKEERDCFIAENIKRDLSLNRNSSSSNLESDSSDEESAKIERKKIEEAKKNGKGNGKQKITESAKLVRLKKYLKVAGIRVQNYMKVFEGCKSKKAKETKLLEILESNGLKGKPTLEKCKKLSKKIAREREVAELDLGNIIDVNGKKGARTRTTRNQMKSVESEHMKDSSIFGNLFGVIDSEESENEYSKQETIQRKKRLKLIESDEES